CEQRASIDAATTRVGGPYRLMPRRPDAERMETDIGDDDAWIEYLEPDECRRLVAAHPVGRVAALVHGAPEIFPVNHALVDGSVVFRTDDGTKLRALLENPRTCFEVDGLD